MTRAYDEKYLDDAMRNLGEALDYAVNNCGMEPDEFMNLFIAGGLANQFGSGVAKYISGISGTELVFDILDRAGLSVEHPEAGEDYDCSPEYWCGFILAYYQWYTGRSFKNIKQNVSMEEIIKLYPALHEAAEEKFIDILNKIISNRSPDTRLGTLRKAAGYSQKKLAEKSGVALRMIQQYEQRAKDINKASGARLLALARTLGCNIEDLMEYDTSEIEEE